MILKSDPRVGLSSPSLNEKLLESAIRHAIHLERLKTGETNRILALLNDDVIPDLLARVESNLNRIGSRGLAAVTSKRFEDLLEAVRIIVREGVAALRADAEASLFEIGRFESDWQTRTIAKSAPIEFDFTLPAGQTLRSIVTARPMQGMLLREWWSTVEVNTRAKVTQQLRIGLVQGESVQAITKRLRGTRALGYADGILQESRRHVQSIVRTAVNHVSTHAREETWRANRDLVKGVIIVATLDTRTTPICRDLDGKVYAIGRGPRPPFHWGCRTTTSVVLKSARELGLSLRDLPEGSRASMNGLVPKSTTYYQWLSRQDVATQNEALGPRRAALFRSGAVKAEQFVDDRGRPLTLEELMGIEGSAA